MNRRMIPALGCALLMASAAATAELTIGVINPTWIVEQSPQYEAARGELQKEVQTREEQIVEQQKQIAKLQEKLERDGPLMSRDELDRLQNDIRVRDRKLKFAQSEFREELGLRQNELRAKLAKQVDEVVKELAKEKKIDLILSEGIVYFDKRIDLSQEVVKRLSKKAGR